MSFSKENLCPLFITKNILFPTDFSDNIWSPIIYRIKLYSGIEDNFCFLHSTKITA